VVWLVVTVLTVIPEVIISGRVAMEGEMMSETLILIGGLCVLNKDGIVARRVIKIPSSVG
jgi:hypothetical protein